MCQRSAQKATREYTIAITAELRALESSGLVAPGSAARVAAQAGAQTYLRLFSLTAGGAYLARGALAAVRGSSGTAQHVALARFFAENLLTAAPGLKESVVGGAESTLAYALAG